MSDGLSFRRSCAALAQSIKGIGFYDRLSAGLRWIFFQRIQGPPILATPLNFEGARDFRLAWRDIREEALAVAANLGAVPRFHEIMAEQADISANDGRDWRMFMLKAYGVEFPSNLARCPALAALLRAHPEVLTASFSFFAPGKRVPRHSGPFKGILRYHLGLVTPRDAEGRPGAGLRILDREYHLAEGEGLLWDDTFPHEAWNLGKGVRIALLLDVKRPGMPLDMRLLSGLIVLVVRVGIALRGVKQA
ncbi:aspartyl/asparaginyl beta-hydroxylase domain-containing protein [Limibacillus halophilus]